MTRPNDIGKKFLAPKITSLRNIISISASVLLLFIGFSQLFARVIPEEDTRTVHSMGFFLNVSNNGSFGREGGLLQSFEGPFASYLYGSGWLVLAKAGGVWVSYSTIPTAYGDAAFVPGSFYYEDQYDPLLKDYNQVYLTKDYDTTTGREKFGGIGPRWPLWNDDGDLTYSYGPYGVFIADTTALESDLPIPGSLPAFPDNLRAFTVSKAYDRNNDIKLELQLFYSILATQNAMVTTARLINYGTELDSVYIFHLSDVDINNPESPFTGTNNDIAVPKVYQLPDYPYKTIDMTSERGPAEAGLELNFIHKTALWASPRDQFLSPISAHSLARTYKAEARALPKIIAVSSGRFFETPLNKLATLIDTDTNDVNGDIWALASAGPYQLLTDSEDSDRIEFMTALFFTEKAQSQLIPSVSAVTEALDAIDQYVLRKNYLPVGTSKDVPITNTPKSLYFDKIKRTTYYLDEQGKRVYITLDGRIID
jgi:hypothetical protein